MKTPALKTLRGLLVVWSLFLVLTGCGGKQASPTVGSPNETQQDSVNRRLNDPHISEVEKQQIRQHMGQTAGTNSGGGQ